MKRVLALILYADEKGISGWLNNQLELYFVGITLFLHYKIKTGNYRMRISTYPYLDVNIVNYAKSPYTIHWAEMPLTTRRSLEKALKRYIA